MAPEAAKELAIQALAYLAQEPERIAPFLASAGIDAGDIRAVADEAAFLSAILDYVTADETLLLAFAEEAGCDPVLVAAARVALAGHNFSGPD